jgi:hypothetical protein
VLGFGACGAKFNEYGPLFLGLLGPTHRGDGVLRFLYTNQTTLFGRFLEGDGFGLVTILEIES